MTQEILVLTPQGKTGRRVASLLQAQDVVVRVGSRTSAPPFDWRNPATWESALTGVDAAVVVYVPDIGFPGSSADIASFAELAVSSGARRLVLLSGRGEKEAQHCEQIVRDSGADWTIIRASWFNQNFSEGFLLDPVRGGVIAMPAGDTLEPFVDVDDIADVVVAALTDEKHIGNLYEVTGPRLLTVADTAREISAATGREVQYLAVTNEQYREAAIERGLPPEIADLLIGLFTETLAGHNSYVTDGIQMALGRAPRDFTDYAVATALTGIWDPQ